MTNQPDPNNPWMRPIRFPLGPVQISAPAIDACARSGELIFNYLRLHQSTEAETEEIENVYVLQSGDLIHILTLGGTTIVSTIEEVNETKPLNPIQTKYITAKVAVETSMERILERIARETSSQPETNTEQWAAFCEAIYEEEGYYPLRDALLAAEQDLLTWARSVLEKNPVYQAVEVDKLFGSRFPSIHKKLIDICLRLRD